MLKQENLFTINETAEKTGVHPQTLRNWEKSGLITPLQKFGNHRLFTEEHISNIKEIQKLKKDGYRLKGIKNVMEKGDNKMKKVEKTETVKKNNSKYNKMSIDELTEIAKSKGIKYFRQMFKEELVEALSKPRNATKMSEQAKQRTRERYGDKKYGQQNQLLVASAKMDNKSKGNSTKGLLSKRESEIENIINLYQSGKTIKEIAKIIK